MLGARRYPSLGEKAGVVNGHLHLFTVEERFDTAVDGWIEVFLECLAYDLLNFLWTF